jgi:hypothetical protein
MVAVLAVIVPQFYVDRRLETSGRPFLLRPPTIRPASRICGALQRASKDGDVLRSNPERSARSPTWFERPM